MHWRVSRQEPVEKQSHGEHHVSMAEGLHGQKGPYTWCSHTTATENVKKYKISKAQLAISIMTAK